MPQWYLFYRSMGILPPYLLIEFLRVRSKQGLYLASSSGYKLGVFATKSNLQR